MQSDKISKISTFQMFLLLWLNLAGLQKKGLKNLEKKREI